MTHVPIVWKSEVIKEFPQNKFIAYTHWDPHWGAKLAKASWTNEEYDLWPKKHGTRHFEEYPLIEGFSTDYNPMYSSFSKDKIYSPKPVKVLWSSLNQSIQNVEEYEPSLVDDLHC